MALHGQHKRRKVQSANRSGSVTRAAIRKAVKKSKAKR